MADVFAWIMLALVVALLGTHTGYTGFFTTVLGLLAVGAVVFLLLRPFYAWLLRTRAPDGQVSVTVLAAILIGVFGCAAVTQWLGLHEVFGAFLFGACLPRDDRLLKAMVQRLEYVSVAALMPIFFALAGLNTTANAFVGTGLGIMALLLLAGISGKVLGGAAGARLAGFGWRDSFATGALMNARGLMELIVMKVGLDAGVIGPQLFTMLLIMALVTTFMTSPLIRLFAGPAALPLKGDAPAAGQDRASHR
jgi:Kef-type K+ transport system membrane component KefB